MELISLLISFIESNLRIQRQEIKRQSVLLPRVLHLIVTAMHRMQSTVILEV